MKREERGLYRAIGDMFRRQGYEKVIIDNFSVQPYKEGKGRRIDVVACQWKGDDLQTVAVECKRDSPPDGIIKALPQAIDAMLFVDETYVATPAAEDLRGVSLLNKLGIGYISVKDDSAFVVHRPNPNKLKLKDEEKYICQVRSRLKTLMIFDDFASESRVRSGGTRTQYCWAAKDIVPSLEVQHNIWLNMEDDCFHSGINFEKREPVLKIADGLKAKTLTGFVKAVESLPTDYRILVKEHKGIGEDPEEVLTLRTKDFSIARGRTLVKRMKSLRRKKGARIEVSIHRPIWAVTEDVSRKEGKKRLATVDKEITPVIGVIDSAAR